MTRTFRKQRLTGVTSAILLSFCATVFSVRASVAMKNTTWTQWSSCTNSCGNGVRVRSQQCTAGTSCIVKQAYQIRECIPSVNCLSKKTKHLKNWSLTRRQEIYQILNNMINARKYIYLKSKSNQEAWSPWTPWSECDCLTMTRTRNRNCVKRCKGHGIETESCQDFNCTAQNVHSFKTDRSGTHTVSSAQSSDFGPTELFEFEETSSDCGGDNCDSPEIMRKQSDNHMLKEQLKSSVSKAKFHYVSSLMNLLSEMNRNMFTVFGKSRKKRSTTVFVSNEDKRNKSRHALKWSQWSQWTECSATCGTGHIVRSRHCMEYRLEALKERKYLRKKKEKKTGRQVKPGNCVGEDHAILDCPTNRSRCPYHPTPDELISDEKVAYIVNVVSNKTMDGGRLASKFNVKGSREQEIHIAPDGNILSIWENWTPCCNGIKFRSIVCDNKTAFRNFYRNERKHHRCLNMKKIMICKKDYCRHRNSTKKHHGTHRKRTRSVVPLAILAKGHNHTQARYLDKLTKPIFLTLPVATAVAVISFIVAIVTWLVMNIKYRVQEADDIKIVPTVY